MNPVIVNIIAVILITKAAIAYPFPEYFFGCFSISFKAFKARNIETKVNPMLNSGIKNPKLKKKAVFA